MIYRMIVLYMLARYFWLEDMTMPGLLFLGTVSYLIIELGRLIWDAKKAKELRELMDDRIFNAIYGLGCKITAWVKQWSKDTKPATFTAEEIAAHKKNMMAFNRFVKTDVGFGAVIDV